MMAAKVTSALIKSVQTNPDPFMTYGDFGRAFGLSQKVTVSWANRGTLDAVASALKIDPKVAIDLTFLLRSKAGGFPMVIDGLPYVPDDKVQEQRARDVADQIIAQFKLTAKNPY
ncbi:MAG TPA: hypothetical protein VGA15_17295 [Bradyrhizobium sp.]